MKAYKYIGSAYARADSHFFNRDHKKRGKESKNTQKTYSHTKRESNESWLWNVYVVAIGITMAATVATAKAIE